MFRIRYINFAQEARQSFHSLREAMHFGKKAGFEFTVSDEFGIVVAWSPIGGTREYRAITKSGELRHESPR